MNTKTRKELNKLADLLSVDGNLDGALETNTFTNLAIDVAKKNNILSEPTIRTYSDWLKCKVFDILEECEEENYPDISDDVFDELFTELDEQDGYIPLFDENGYEVDWAVQLDNLGHLITQMQRDLKAMTEVTTSLSMNASSNTYSVKKKVYSLFNEDANGRITMTRGTYSKDDFEGLTPNECNQLRGWPCMPGWANLMLEENERLGVDRPGALTDDDIEVLQKIRRNEI